MPAVTTLAFYREEQTIDSFDASRPKSLLALRAACRREVDQLLHSLRLLELQYLHPHETHEDFVREKLFTFKRVMMAGGVREMHKAYDMESALEAVNSLGQESLKFVESVQKIRAVQSHVSEFLPERFSHFSERLLKILNCLRKYCLSFYRGSLQRKPDQYLDTPFKYELARGEMATKLQRDIMGLTEKYFMFGSVGVSLQTLTYSVQQLGRRCGCADISLFLLFPESCERVREACRQIDDWLEKDKEYLENLGNDLMSMDNERERLHMQFQAEYTSMVQLKHSLAGIEKRIQKYEGNVDEFKTKKQQVNKRHHQALVELRRCEYHLHRAKTVLGEVKKRPEMFGSDEDLRRSKQECVLELRRQRTVYPRVSKRADLAESIVKSCEAKEAGYEADKKEAINLRYRIDKLARVVGALQDRIDRIDRYEKIVYHIHTLKRSPASLKKIFHNLELDTRLQGVFTSERCTSPLPVTRDIEEYTTGDPVLTACKAVAHFIENDWHRLYLTLPFYPPRGEVDRDADVDRIDKKFVRGSKEELAAEALQMWRRLHTRANVDALRQALLQLGRQDVEQKMSSYLARKLRPAAATDRSDAAAAAVGGWQQKQQQQQQQQQKQQRQQKQQQVVRISLPAIGQKSTTTAF